MNCTGVHVPHGRAVPGNVCSAARPVTGGIDFGFMGRCGSFSHRGVRRFSFDLCALFFRTVNMAECAMTCAKLVLEGIIARERHRFDRYNLIIRRGRSVQVNRNAQ